MIFKLTAILACVNLGFSGALEPRSVRRYTEIISRNQGHVSYFGDYYIYVNSNVAYWILFAFVYWTIVFTLNKIFVKITLRSALIATIAANCFGLVAEIIVSSNQKYTAILVSLYFYIIPSLLAVLAAKGLIQVQNRLEERTCRGKNT